MKESMKKLIKNKMFRKIAMSAVFVLMCLFACFVNWRAIVGAENGNNCTLSWNEDAYWKVGDYYPYGTVETVEYKNSSNEGAQYTPLPMTGGNGRPGNTFNFVNSEDLYVKVTFSQGNILGEGNLCLFYNCSDTAPGCENNRKALAIEADQHGDEIISCIFHFEAGSIPDAETYSFHILPKSYSFSAGNFAPLLSDDTDFHSSYNVLDINYSVGESSPTNPFPTRNYAGAYHYPDGVYYDTLYFASPTRINLSVAGKDGFDTTNLECTTATGTVGPDSWVRWSETSNTFNIDDGNSSINVHFKSPNLSLSVWPKDGEGTLGDKINVYYSLYNDFTTPSKYDALSPDGENNFLDLSNITAGTKIYVKVEAKDDSYDISALKYSLGDGTFADWPQERVLPITMIGNSTLTLSGVKARVTFTPSYADGTGADNAYFYNAVNLKYAEVEESAAAPGENDYREWMTGETEGAVYYAPLTVTEGQKIYVMATAKPGYYIGDMTHEFNGEASTAWSAQTVWDFTLDANSTIKFDGVKELVTFTPSYGSGSDGDNAYFYNAVELKYVAVKESATEPGENDYGAWDSEGAGDTAHYAPLTIPEGYKAYVKAEVKDDTRYDIGDMTHKFNDEASTVWNFKLDANSTIKFDGVKELVTFTPSYGSGSDADNAYFYNAVNLKYAEVEESAAEPGENDYVDWGYEGAGDAVHYASLTVTKGQKVYVKAEVKDDTRYDIGDMTHEFNGEASTAWDFTLDADSTIKFAGVKELVTFTPSYGSGSDEDNAYFYKSVELKYAEVEDSSAVPGENDYVDWGSEGAGDAAHYASLTVTKEQKVYVKATAKSGYYVDDMTHEFNGEASTAWDFTLDADSTIKFAGVKNMKSCSVSYYNTENQVKNKYFYKAAELKYSLDGEENYKPWDLVSTDDAYNSINLPEDKEIKIRITRKKGYSIKDLKYKLFLSGDAVSFDDWPECFGESDSSYDTCEFVITLTGNSTLAFQGATDKMIDITPEYVDGSESDLYMTTSIQYKKGNDIEHIWDSETGQYKKMSFQEGTKIQVRLVHKTGYDLSNLKYYNVDSSSEDKYDNWFDDTVTEESGREFEILDDTKLSFKNISPRSVNLTFAGEYVNPDFVQVKYGGDEISDYAQTIDANTEQVFVIKLSHCTNDDSEGSRLGLSVPDDSGVTITDSGTTASGDTLGWNDDDKTFTFIVKAVTDSEEVTITINNVKPEKEQFTFKRDESQKMVVGTDVDTDLEWDPNSNQIIVPEACIYGGDFEFYLKCQDGAKWNSTSYSYNNLITIESPSSVGGGTNEISSCKYGGDNTGARNGYYKIKIEKITSPFIIKLNDGAIGTNLINISFPDIMLQKDNKITASQSNADATISYQYANVTTNSYHLTIAISTTDKTKEITISVPPDKDDFYFDREQPVHYVIVGGAEYSNANISADGKEFKFALSNDASSNQTINIECKCLVGSKKKLSFELNGGVKEAKIFDVINSAEPIGTIADDGGDSAKQIEVPYGREIEILAELHENNNLDDYEDQIKVYKITPTSEQEQTGWGACKKNSDRVYSVTFNEPVSSDMKISFNCDQTKIPISFKNITGANCYALNLIPDSQHKIIGFDESSPFVIKSGTENEKEELKGIVTVPSGSDYFFAVNVDAGYDIGKLVMTQNGHEMDGTITSQSGQDEQDDKWMFVEYTFENRPKEAEGFKFYKLINIKSNITVAGSAELKMLKVDFKNPIGVEGTQNETTSVIYKRDGAVVNSLDIPYGGTAAFSVTLDNEKYNQSDFQVRVRNKGDNSEGALVTKYQNEYRVLDITEDKEVYVTGITVNSYILNFVANDKAEFLLENNNAFSGTKGVSYGSSFEFKIKAKQGYTLDRCVVNYQTASKSGSIKKQKDSGSGENIVYKCKLNGIKENCTITIEDIDRITYKVSFQDVAGATYFNDKGSVVSGKMTVGYGKNFEFSVGVDDAYDDSAAGMFIVLNDGKSELSAQKLASGRYMIPNITEDVKIKVGNIRKNTYTVTLRNEEGIDYYNPDNKLITGDNIVDHGGSLSFKVSLYPAYSDSSITVMLGNDKMTPDSSGYYTISGVIEDKMVTVTGIHPNAEVDLINTINNLPSTVNDLNDVNSIIEASKWYNALSDEQKANVTNAGILAELQQQAGALLHKSNDVTIDGPDWYIKLVVVPISSDMDACARIYKKLSSEYILSLYDIYLWDTLNDVRYVPSGDTMYTVTIPTPRLENFKNPTGIHEDSNSGKVSFMDLSFNGDTVSFQTNSFSPMGIVANHDPTGASSLFDAAGVNLGWIQDYVLGGAKSGSSGRDSSDGTLINNDDTDDNYDDEDIGNINDKFRSVNNRVTPQGSALRLILVLLILILLALAIWIIYKKHKENKESK